MTTPEAHYRTVTFNHANTKRPVHVVAGTLAYYMWSEPVKAVVVYTTGGGAFPVTETLEEIDQLINQLSKGENK